MRFTIFHKQSKQTLRQYAKQNEIEGFWNGVRLRKDLKEYTLKYFVNEDGNFGFHYFVNDWYGGHNVVYLPKLDWEIEYR